MTNWVFLVPVLAAVLACAQVFGQRAAPPADVWSAILAGALLVDVRTRAEFDAGHLEGAILIPHEEIAVRSAELGGDKARSIVVYCRSGHRSGKAARALADLGYVNVINGGGYEGLKQAQSRQP